jgi:hypothetical protein
METEDKISFNEMDGLNIHDDVYRKVIKDFNILYERDKMGGDEGIHLVVSQNKTPYFKWTPICKIKFLENF